MIKSLYAKTQLLPSVYDSSSCSEAFRKIWEADTIDQFESLYVIYLNSKNEHFANERICIGNYSFTCFDPRQIVHYALHYKSPSLIIAHNHTFGQPDPSSFDIEITEQLLTVLNFLEIKLVDHIILTPENYFSFQDAGLLKRDIKNVG